MAPKVETRSNEIDGGRWLAVIPTVLAAAGVLLFGVLNLGYSQFYGRLGISPDAVGLGYANVLARSTIVVAIVALTVVL